MILKSDMLSKERTDIIKDLAMTSSKDILAHLKANPDILQRQLDGFRKEISFLGTDKPIILAFGK